MLSPKLKIGFRMAEVRRRPEMLIAVTIHTTSLQGALVVIVVAAQAVLFKAQPGKILFKQFLIIDKIFFVTGFTLLFRMRAFQRITRKDMIEGVRIETDNLKVPSMMIVVAFIAMLILHFPRNVVTTIVVDQEFDGGMAIEALFVGNLFTQGVAFGAVGKPLKMSVHFGQFTRGYLSRCQMNTRKQ
jgi:hypothetical protein